jgi:hypothetical protein
MIMIKKYKSAVGAVICNCEKYIQEWCCFQYLTGFDKTIICLDRCTDNTFNKIQGLPYEVLERVDVFANSATRPDVGYQFRGYQHIYDRYKDEVEWLAMFDDDEYLYDHKNRTVNEILQNIPVDVAQVALPWINFTHSRQILSAPPETTRLAHFRMCEIEFPYTHIKVLVRLDYIKPSEIMGGWYYTHSADVLGRSMTANGDEVTLHGNQIQTVAAHFETCLAHYIYGAMEDWVIKYKKWRIENDYTKSVNSSTNWDRFMKDSNTQDDRMLVYVDRLRELLAQCK